jgi:anaerobic selenocysteine-containing dehydrogenase
MSAPVPSMPGRLLRLLHDSSGPLTRELLLNSPAFGLPGRVDSHRPEAVVKSVCGYCSTGCSLSIHLQDGEAVSLSPTTPYPVNLGMACPKGWQALDVLDAPDRATVPLLRTHRNGPLQPISWEKALQTFCERFQEVQNRHGRESVAFLSTGQIPTEEMAMLGSLAKFGMGMRHGDGNTRQCMATSVVAYKESFGFDAPPFTYADFEESDVLVFVGANPCIAHPILWERVTRNPHNPEIIVIDPRLTETAAQATLHVPVRPKRDLVLLYGLANLLIVRNWIDRDYIDRHCRDFDKFAKFVAAFTPDVVADRADVAPEMLIRLAERIHSGQRVSFWWTMGVNQSHEGVRTAQAIINLALMTGNIGRPGTGANSITGQCNAMGSRLFSNTASLLGGRDFANATHRREVADILNIPEDNIPTQPSWAYNEILDGIRSGNIRGLWIIATNTAHSWIQQDDARELLSRLDFLVVQDMYHSTETATLSDLVLPAAGWGEKDGTFINSERRYGVIRAVKKAPGQALSDFRIFRLIAEAWGCGHLFRDWTSPETVFQKLKQLSEGSPCDISGIADYRMLDRLGGVQWPCTRQDAEQLNQHIPSDTEIPFAVNQRRLFSAGQFFHSDGRARFVFEEPRSLSDPTDAEYPFTLLTGRGTASQWHTQTRTAKSAMLRKLYPQDPYLELSQADANSLGIADGDQIEVSSRRAAVMLRVVITTSVRPGQVFAPMHYECVNRLTHASFDPYSKQPSYKASAVRLRTLHREGRASSPQLMTSITARENGTTFNEPAGGK